MLRHWFRYQMTRSKVAYVPAYRRCADRKSLLRSIVEVAALGAYWRCVPFHYLRYGLYERGHGFRDLFTYLPETVFYYRLLAQANTDTVLLDDKLVSKRVLGDAGVPQARLLLSGDDRYCIDAMGTPVPVGALEGVLKDGQQLVVKPSRYSSGGDGVLVLRYRHGALRDDDQRAVSLNEYGTVWGSWLAEEFVQQHESLAVLNHHSLNTFRVITTWHPTRGAQVEYCILKLGASAGLVDNAHDGGLYIRVDKETGALSDVAFDESFTRHRHHPLTGMVFASHRIGVIRDVVALAERAAGLFPQTTLIGWDIAVGEDGPLIIEGNSSPGLTNVQRTHGGVAHTLGRYLSTSRPTVDNSGK